MSESDFYILRKYYWPYLRCLLSLTNTICCYKSRNGIRYSIYVSKKACDPSRNKICRLRKLWVFTPRVS